MFRKTMMLIAAVMLICSFAGPGLSAPANDADTIVATVNGVKISQQDFNREMESAQQYFASQGHTVAMPEIKKAVIDKLINGELLYAASQEKGIKITQEKIDNEYNSFRSRFPDDQAFHAALAKLSIDDDGIKVKIKQSLAVEQFVDQEFFEKTKIPEQEVKDYYENNIKAFATPESVRASHILISVKEDADKETKDAARKKLERIRKKIIAGGNFAEFAKNNSDCPSKAKGGDLGFFSRGQMVKPFETAAFSMMPGDVSEVVETQFGYHLIKLIEKKHAETASYDDSKVKIETYLRQSKSQEALNEFLKDTREKAKITLAKTAE